MAEETRGDGNGRGDSKPLYAGIVTAGAVVAYVMQTTAIEPVYKLVFVGIAAVGGFAAFVVRYILQIFDWHIKRHDALSQKAHAEQCATLGEIRNALRTINGKVEGG